ncbi:hypothetical protein [Micromonospora chokoriensis]|uniref:Uncharacterized protein n=1 Tax=Micromonospora chokoriensis TaxID=356851 RepID=A0A1C4YER7_9ACTN|nr:hypothetical protein [Micromonospora chokoriensis]SCF19217.1 hypothetical protein GA0070612_4649 [Micromonospora chokoriensis]
MWATLVILLTTYLALRQIGIAENRADDWANAAAAFVAVVLLWRVARRDNRPPPEPLEAVPRAKLARRVLALAALTWFVNAVVGGFVAGFVPLIPPGESPDHAVALAVRLHTTVALPIILIIIFQIGRLSATWLALDRPLRWLAMISVAPALVAIALHSTVVAYSQTHGTIPVSSLPERLPMIGVNTLLIFCALAMGHLSRREALSKQPGPVLSADDRQD